MQTPIYVRATNDHTKLGIVVSENVFQTPVTDEKTGETRVEFISLLGVCWEGQRSPAIDYVYPKDLEWLAIEAITNVDEDEDEYEDEDEDDADEFDEDEGVLDVSPEQQI